MRYYHTTTASRSLHKAKQSDWTNTDHAECTVVEKVVRPVTAGCLHSNWRVDLHLIFSLVEYFAGTAECRHDVL